MALSGGSHTSCNIEKQAMVVVEGEGESAGNSERRARQFWLNHWFLGSLKSTPFLDILTSETDQFLLFEFFWIVLILQLIEKCHQLLKAA